MSELPSTIIHPEAFKRNLPAGFDGAMDWQHWKSAIDTRNIEPMDIDANVEINNFKLKCESKDDGRDASPGQMRALASEVRSGLSTVLFQWGKIIPVRWQVHSFNHWSPVYSAARLHPKFPGVTAAEQIWQFIRWWAHRARSRDSNAWRISLFNAALRDCPDHLKREFYNHLRCEMDGR